MEEGFEVLNRHWQLRGKFNKQVAEILHTVRMSPEEVEGLQLLYDDIQHTFSDIWPGSAMKAFGSVVTGLAFKGSDVDCYLQLLAHCNDSPESCALKSRDVIASGRSPFQHAHVIMKKVPTVQFFHAKTGKICELSFNKPIAVEFGKLVGYLLSLDPRALKLAVLIKCWAKTQKITGTKLLPSNALIILIIFFLQQKQILPSVAMLQENSLVNIIDNWNVAFTEMRYESRNRQSIYNLLGEFFAYYSNFDFRNLIVCPYLGYPVEKCKFEDIRNLPAEFQLYKENLNANICEPLFLHCMFIIQDPFDHARNCAGPVKPNLAIPITRYIKGAAAVYENSSQYEVLNKLLSYQYSALEYSVYIERRKPPPRNKNTYRTRVGQRSTPRSRAYRARGLHFRKML